jgi:hypothetical protein
MRLIKKIDLQLFIPLSLIATLAFCFFAKGWLEIGVIFIVYFATLINLYLLMYIVSSMILSEEVRLSGNMDKFKILLFFVAKVCVLFLALILGVHLIGNRIVIAILNYVVQIFVLGVAMRKNLKS